MLEESKIDSLYKVKKKNSKITFKLNKRSKIRGSIFRRDYIALQKNSYTGEEGREGGGEA